MPEAGGAFAHRIQVSPDPKRYMMDEQDPVEIPVNGTLDLHSFQPNDVKDLVPEYIRACRELDILQVRIIHGKGTGALKRTVRSILERLHEVESISSAPESAGGWGATVATLYPIGDSPSPHTADPGPATK